MADSPRESRSTDAATVKWLLIAGVVVAVIFVLKSGFLSKIGGLMGGVADTANAALKTVRRIGSDIDPFNSQGRLRAATRAIDPSKPIKGAAKAVGSAVGGAVKSVKKLKFW